MGKLRLARAATSSEVRKHYEALGHTAKVDWDGYVHLKLHGIGDWTCGQRVTDYIVNSSGQVVMMSLDPTHKPPALGWAGILNAILK